MEDHDETIEHRDEIMSEEERRDQEEFLKLLDREGRSDQEELQKVVDREVRLEGFRIGRLICIRNFIRKTDCDDKEIASLVDVDEEYVKDARSELQRLSKEELDNAENDFDYERFVRDVAEVRHKIRWAYYELKEGFFDMNAMDEEISLRTWAGLEMVKRLRHDLFPGMDKQLPRTPLEAFKELPKRFTGQLIENMVVVEPGLAYVHQDTLRAVFLPMTEFIQSQNLGKVLFSPFHVYLDEKNVFQPDILFVAVDRLNLIKHDGLHGAPDLVIEALSIATGKFDRDEKKHVYERSGVKEYWIINPDTSEVQGYQLINGAFKAFPSAKGLIRSPLLGREFKF